MPVISKAKSSHSKSRKTGHIFFPAVIFLAILAISLGPQAVLASNSQSQVSAVPKIQVKPGFDNYYKLNSWLPIKVDLSLTAGNQSFEGWLEASFTNFGVDSPVYRRAVELTPPADREIWIYLPTGNHSLQEVQVRLAGQDGAVLYSQSIPIYPLDQSNLVVGVISDNPDALITLNSLRLTQPYNKGSLFYSINYYSKSPPPGIIPAIKIIHLQPQDLPPDASGWDSLDGLVLTGLSNVIPVDLLQKTTDYLNAAAGWLVQGRFLFIAGDSGLNRSGFLADFLPVKPAGVPRNSPLPDQLRSLQSGPTAAYLVAVASMVPGATAQLSLDGKPFLVEKPFGLGRSLFSAADFTTLPPSVLAELWQMALNNYEPHLSYSNGLRLPGDTFPPWTSQLSPNTKVAALPDLNIIALVLGFYILLLGPVSYAVLKKVGRRELGWLVTPGLVVIFSTGFYLAGALTSGEPLVLSRVSIVMLSETTGGKMVGGVTGLGTIYSGSRNSVALQVNDQTQAVSLSGNRDNFNLTGFWPDANLSAIRQGPGGGFGTVNLGQDEQRSFALESVVPQEVGEGIFADLTEQGSEITGTIENRSSTDWTNLSIWSSGNLIYRIPLIKTGEKMTLQKTNLLKNQTDSLVLVLAGLVDGNAGTSNSVMAFGSPAYQSQEVTILNTLIGSEGQVLPKGAKRVYLIGWSQATYSFPLKIENQTTSSKDLTLLFEPLTLS